MRVFRRSALALGVIVIAPVAIRAQGRDSIRPDTLRVDTTSIAEALPGNRNSGIRLSSGHTYNRTEGLPIILGPWFQDSVGSVRIHADVSGIMRTANRLHWDGENIGHSANLGITHADPAGRGWTATASSYDVVDAVEPWTIGSAESGLASLFFHRDYRDYFGRHGAKAGATFLTSARSSFSVEWADERWASRSARKVFSIWDNGARWRPNAAMDNGRFHIGTARAQLDSRNNPATPTTGSYLLAEYELGSGKITAPGVISALARPLPVGHTTYGRMLLDVRSYNRISPASQLNARLVLGGWLHGDPLPMERRFSVGGVGSLPGYDFRDATLPGADVFQCNSGGLPPPGSPAQCERMALAQLEFRSQLHAHFLDVVNSRPIRLRGIGFTVRPAVVAFADAGRGWLVGDRSSGLRYPRWSIPPLGSFRTDVGLGLDLGIFGVYAAKAVTVAKEPANIFLRVNRRF